jgi:hypothetical protein
MESDKRGLVSRRVMEIAVGTLIFAVGVVLMYDAQRERDIDERGDADDQADIEREVARLRPVHLLPAEAQAHAVGDDDSAENEEERRYDQLGALGTKRGPTRVWTGIYCYFPAMKPAAFMSCTWRASSFATQSAYCLPASMVVLNAPSSISFFHSGVAVTFLKRST